ncbi:bifunctional 4-hydroxy-2-oxoglutarate aldolase/2-dehydro-3-deoxy-phosphogluconate aldolase [Streptomyces sp. NPDC006785]|uniref:bifunctional 4-hydroxy-2-oxoglutarate aldolase/2-dehydro-3-deoxy-phosphogluconate aldolase n=1 Tax=Streptomyces sp. NPDC006785 TaxID=3155461 RepID=UPI0033ECA507
MPDHHGDHLPRSDRDSARPHRRALPRDRRHAVQRRDPRDRDHPHHSRTLRCIRQLTAAYGREAVIGAGTVLTAGQAQTCVDAGARFLVSPVAAPDVVRTARAAGVAAYPGALTPTEIHAAARTGAPAVKLFPASAVSPRYVSDLLGPLPGIPLIPTGGISLADIPAWIAAGVAAVGLGTPLIGTAATEGVDDRLAGRCRQALAAVREGRAAR